NELPVFHGSNSKPSLAVYVHFSEPGVTHSEIITPKPTTERAPDLAPISQPRPQTQHSLTENLTDPGLADRQDFADLLEIELFIVVQRQHQALPLGQGANGLRQTLLKSSSLKPFEGAWSVLSNGVRDRLSVVDQFLKTEQAATGTVLQAGVIFFETHAQLRGNFRILGITSGPVLNHPYRLGNTAGITMHGPGRPIALTDLVHHSTPNPDTGIGFERCPLAGVVSASRL